MVRGCYWGRAPSLARAVALGNVGERSGGVTADDADGLRGMKSPSPYPLPAARGEGELGRSAGVLRLCQGGGCLWPGNGVRSRRTRHRKRRSG